MLKVIIPPERDLLGLEEVKNYLRLDHTHEDEMLLRLIRVATQLTEQETGRSFLLQRLQLAWTPSTAIHDSIQGKTSDMVHIPLPNPPLVNIVEVEAIRPDTKRTFLKRFMVDQGGALPVLKVLCQAPLVGVTYDVGYGKNPENVPACLRQAVLLAVVDLYENRSSVGERLRPNPLREMLLSSYRVLRFGG